MPLVIYFPPCPTCIAGGHTPIPEFLSRYPVAVINYRWSDLSFGSYEPEVMAGAPPEHSMVDEDIDDFESDTFAGTFPTPCHWPTPVHDALFGYQWIVSALSPPGYTRRDIYLYGTHLGASLASSLALTESYPFRRVAVRGVAAYNGVYNWTMFLHGHPIYRPKSSRSKSPKAQQFRPPLEGSWFHYLHQNLGQLFNNPANTFDPFASPGLFFHNPGLLVPLDFYSDLPAASELIHPELLQMLAKDYAGEDESPEKAASIVFSNIFKKPRKGTMRYPSRDSALQIPQALFLYDVDPQSAVSLETDDPLQGRHNRPAPYGKRKLSLRDLRHTPATSEKTSKPSKSSKLTGRRGKSGNATKCANSPVSRATRSKASLPSPRVDNTLEGHAQELVHQMRRNIRKYELATSLKHAQEWEVEEIVGEVERRVRIAAVRPVPDPHLSTVDEQGLRESWLHVGSGVEEQVSAWLADQVKHSLKQQKRPPWALDV